MKWLVNSLLCERIPLRIGALVFCTADERVDLRAHRLDQVLPILREKLAPAGDGQPLGVDRRDA